MSKSIQYIEKDGKREYAIVPIALFERLIEDAEDLEDIALLDEFRRTDDGFRIPGDVAHVILDGMHPVKAWREYRQLTQDTLAGEAGISTAYLCQIETGKRKGAVKTLKSLARTRCAAGCGDRIIWISRPAIVPGNYVLEHPK